VRHGGREPRGEQEVRPEPGGVRKALLQERTSGTLFIFDLERPPIVARAAQYPAVVDGEQIALEYDLPEPIAPARAVGELIVRRRL
jgi:hypothetical protein